MTGCRESSLGESAELAAYGWSAEEASQRMRAISAAIRVESDVLAALPEWADVTVLEPA